MTTRIKLLVAAMLIAAGFSLKLAAQFPSHDWIRFSVYLVAVLLSSSLKVAMPKGDRTMSVNFPFILLGIIQLSPGQAIALGAISVFAQCRIKVLKPFTLVQIAFNVANVIVSTLVAWACFTFSAKHHVELAVALSIAATGYFLVNTAAFAVVMGWSTDEAPFSLWRREFPWYLPFYLVGAALAAVVHLISLRYGWTTSLLLIPVIYTIYRAYRSQMKSLQDRQAHMEETEALHLRTIEGLAMAIEAKDHNTHAHLLRVRVYVAEIGASMGLDKPQTQALLTAALLHDIGKLAVPEYIINKPGKLTPEEFDKMKIHPVVGAEILERVRFPYPVVPIVRGHHEAWDGSGYPDGLAGEEIPLGARILTVVDCFDALASDRPYRKALPIEEAMQFVKGRAGSQFDPKVVAILEQRYIELEELASKQQNDGLAPLNTEISVWRGAAPSAGFQQENVGAAEKAAETLSSGTFPEFTVGPRTTFESLNLIATASQEAQALFEMGRTLGNALRPNEMISIMSFRLRDLLPFQCFAVYLKSDESLSVRYTDGEGAHCFSAAPIPIGEGLSGWVAHSGKAILNGNPRVESNYVAGAGAAVQMNSALAVPLFDLKGDIFGVLTIYSAGVDSFSRDHLRILQAVEAKFSLALSNAIQFENGAKDVEDDSIAQLPDIGEFFIETDAELAMARRSEDVVAVVVCDLNSFKSVLDVHGRPMGDSVLRSIASGLRGCCQPNDTVARIGGTEFVFLMRGVDAKTCSSRMEVITQMAKKTCKDLRIETEASTNMDAAFYPADGKTAEELLGLANRRMHLQKRAQVETIRQRRDEFPPQMAAVA
jgi:diguanylate cyclase (GGDEF)-like protein/putative nucleotidyltransferase with HDIG domain